MCRIRCCVGRLAILSRRCWFAPAVSSSADVVPDDVAGRPGRGAARPDGRDHDRGPRELEWRLGVALRAAGPARRGSEGRDGRAAQDQGRGGGRRRAARARFEPGSRSRPTAPLGPRELRVATPQGVSSVGLVVVVDDPVVAEADDLANDRPAAAQKLTFPTVVSGRIGKLEDVDWYAFDAEKGQRVTFRGLG